MCKAELVTTGKGMFRCVRCNNVEARDVPHYVGRLHRRGVEPACMHADCLDAYDSGMPGVAKGNDANGESRLTDGFNYRWQIDIAGDRGNVDSQLEFRAYGWYRSEAPRVQGRYTGTRYTSPLYRNCKLHEFWASVVDIFDYSGARPSADGRLVVYTSVPGWTDTGLVCPELCDLWIADVLSEAAKRGADVQPLQMYFSDGFVIGEYKWHGKEYAQWATLAGKMMADKVAQAAGKGKPCPTSIKTAVNSWVNGTYRKPTTNYTNRNYSDYTIDCGIRF